MSTITGVQVSHPANTHEFSASICKDEDGFIAFAVDYPGVLSWGDTFEEAKANIADAFLEVLAASRARGRDMHLGSWSVDFPAESQVVLVRCCND